MRNHSIKQPSIVRLVNLFKGDKFFIAGDKGQFNADFPPLVVLEQRGNLTKVGLVENGKVEYLESKLQVIRKKKVYS